MDFVDSLSNMFHVSPSATRVSVVQFKNGVLKHFCLDTFTTNEQVSQAIETKQYIVGFKNSAAEAVEFVTSDIYSMACGMRTDSTKITVFQTHSFANSPPSPTPPPPMPCLYPDVDLVFLLDTSHSVSDADVQAQIDLTTRLASDMVAKSRATRVSVAHYTEETTMIWCLDDFTTTDGLSVRLNEWNQGRINDQPRSATQTSDVATALNHVTSSILTSECGAREDSESIVVLLTDGIQNVPEPEPGCPEGYFGFKCMFGCECAGRAVCDNVTGACPGACSDGKWGPGCQLDNHCYYNGFKQFYQGTLSQSKSGKTCQAWSSNSPQRHRYKDSKQFVDGVMPDNFCRTALYEPRFQPWCYTTDRNRRWEACEINNCECPPHRFGPVCASECHCLDANEACDGNTGRCLSGCAEGWTGDDCQKETSSVSDCQEGQFGLRCSFQCHCLDDMPCHRLTGRCPRGCSEGYWGDNCQLENQCYYNGKKTLYQGTVTQTVNGRQCQYWDRQDPHRHRYTKPTKFVDDVMPDNMCRTPLADKQHDPWCYTEDPDKKWEYCNIGDCLCPAGLFGTHCDKECQCATAGERCDSVTGQCMSGCNFGMTGTDCQTAYNPCEQPLDLTILVDKALSQTNFLQVRTFLEETVEKFVVSPNVTRVNIKFYGSKLFNVFCFDQFFNNEEITRAIQGMRFVSRTSDPAKALNELRNNGFSASCGARPEAAKVAMLISGGLGGVSQAGHEECVPRPQRSSSSSNKRVKRATRRKFRPEQRPGRQGYGKADSNKVLKRGRPAGNSKQTKSKNRILWCEDIPPMTAAANYSDTVLEARRLAQSGVHLITVGVGDLVNVTELEGLASAPDLVFDSLDQFDVNSIKDLLDIQDNCSPVSGQTPNQDNSVSSREAATQLKASGVTLVTVGLPEADTSDLDHMASSNDLSFHSIDQVDSSFITSLVDEFPCPTNPPTSPPTPSPVVDLHEAITLLKANGVSLVTVGIGNDVNSTDLSLAASSPELAFSSVDDVDKAMVTALGPADTCGGTTATPSPTAQVRRKRSSDTEWYSFTKWPKGQYALPATKEGCPAGFFKTGSRVQTASAQHACSDKAPKRACNYWIRIYGCIDNPSFMHDQCPASCNVCYTFGNHVSEPYHLGGTVNGDQVEHQFCVKDDSVDDTDNDVQWPGGQYCIYRVGDTCPDGFDNGDVTFTDQSHGASANSVTGTLPDGVFTGDSTQFQFCCNKYGFVEDDMWLPPTQPFALFRSSNENRCHGVTGMNIYRGYTVIKQPAAVTGNGDTPMYSFQESRNQYQFEYCYYQPANTDCGDDIELTPENPTASISGTNGPDYWCNWMVKGPEGSRILINFDTFDIAAKDNGDCIDKLNVRFNRLAQPGEEYCGQMFEKSLSSVYNTLMVTYNTYDVGQSSFTATVSLIHESNLCYNAEDKGHSYNGKVSITRGFKECLPWAQTTHCPHNPVNYNDATDSLHDNYCRNPDMEDGLRPWCYYEADQCRRDYCDVCMFENRYDNDPDCDKLAAMGYCQNDPNPMELCAETCKDSLTAFPQPPLASSVSCGQPSGVSDGVIISGSKSSYNVGDIVTWQCNDGANPATGEKRCLTSGEWSTLNYVCGACENGWVYRDLKCYKHNSPAVTKDEAVNNCVAAGATLTYAKTEEMNTFLANFDRWSGIWLHGTDSEEEDVWKWDDGDIFIWTNWASGQPDNYANEDCLAQGSNGDWYDFWCTTDKFNYICVKDAYAVNNCEDITDVCSNYFANDPSACVNQAEFMDNHCKKTCGFCNPATCSVEAATQHAQLISGQPSSITQGGYVTYECQAGKVFVSGNTVRGCLENGDLTGLPLVCKEDNEVAMDSSTLEKTHEWGSKTDTGYSYFGVSPHLTIPANGKIVRWEFWNEEEGQGAFQVWRPTGTAGSYDLVGQNVLPPTGAKEKFLTKFYVADADQITVQIGDLIGVYYGDPKFGVGYEKCDAGAFPDHVTFYKSGTTNVAGNAVAFNQETSETCRLYKFRAVILT